MSNAAADEVIVPEHKRCETAVEVPTILVEPPWGEQTVPTVCVQWFGQAGVKMPEGSQFNFPLMASHDHVGWFGHPERFRVAFLDQVKNWPKPETAQATADAVAEGNVDAWIIWVVSSIAGMAYENAEGPVSFAAPLILLGDPNCGPITPQPYLDMGVVAEEAGKLRPVEDPELDEMFPEELPDDQWA